MDILACRDPKRRGSFVDFFDDNANEGGNVAPKPPMNHFSTHYEPPLNQSWHVFT